MQLTASPPRRHLTGPAITDVAGEAAGRVQIERLVQRYYWAASYCEGRKVLEVACGTGQGLGLLGAAASHVCGCDVSMENLTICRSTHADSAALIQADAQSLPFATGALDVLILLETIYFLPNPEQFLAEARRVLAPGGRLLISSINKDCPDFNPNHPLYFAHYGVADLAGAMASHGFTAECFGIIPMDAPSLRARIFRPVKRLAIRLNLIPDSMQARLFLKRVVFGQLEKMPMDIAGQPAPSIGPQPIPFDQPDVIHQVVLCAGTRDMVPFRDG